jgi:prepilin-type processing-associated H-X9-DG protein
LRDANGYGLSHYAANSHVLGPNTALRVGDITDGTSTTLLIGEVNTEFKPWGHPVNWRDPALGIQRSPRGFGGVAGSGGANFVMVDGSVRFISERVSPAVLRALATPNGGESIDPDALDAPR